MVLVASVQVLPPHQNRETARVDASPLTFRRDETVARPLRFAKSNQTNLQVIEITCPFTQDDPNGVLRGAIRPVKLVVSIVRPVIGGFFGKIRTTCHDR